MKLFKAIREALIDFWYGFIRPVLEIILAVVISIVAIFIIMFVFNLIGHSVYP